MTFTQGKNKEYLATMHLRRHVTDKEKIILKEKKNIYIYIFK